MTNAGTIVVELDTKRAPITTKNFLHLVDTRAYDGATFYRTVSKAAVPGSNIEVIQGGLQGVNRIPDQKIALEQTSTTHLHNTSGAISMARTSDPNSGSSEFFLCVGDNTFLDAENQPDHLGYAAFGHVVRGNDVVLKINHSAATSQMPTAPPATPASTQATPAPTLIVHIRDFQYIPKDPAIHVGDTIQYINDDESAHTVTADDKSYDSGYMAKGQTWSKTYTVAGAYPYFCAYHAFMRASVTVK